MTKAHQSEVRATVVAETRRLIKGLEKMSLSLVNMQNPATRSHPRSIAQAAYAFACVRQIKECPNNIFLGLIEMEMLTDAEGLALRQFRGAPSMVKEEE